MAPITAHDTWYPAEEDTYKYGVLWDMMKNAQCSLKHSPYRAVNTLRLGYKKNQSVNAV